MFSPYLRFLPIMMPSTRTSTNAPAPIATHSTGNPFCGSEFPFTSPSVGTVVTVTSLEDVVVITLEVVAITLETVVVVSLLEMVVVVTAPLEVVVVVGFWVVVVVVVGFLVVVVVVGFLVVVVVVVVVVVGSVKCQVAYWSGAFPLSMFMLLCDDCEPAK